LKPGMVNILRSFLAAAFVILAVSGSLRSEKTSFNSEAVQEMIAGYQDLMNNDQEQAAKHLEQALRLDEKSSFLKTLYSGVLYDLHRYKEVIKLLEPLGESGDSVDTQVIKLLALSYQATGQIDKSVRYYKQVIKREPEDEWLRRQLLELLKNQGRYQEIIPIYKPLLDPSSESYAFDMFQMGALYMSIGGREPAREYLEKAIAADSSLADAYRLLGSIEEMEGKWNAALENYLTFLDLQPENSEQVFSRVLAVAVKLLYPEGRWSSAKQGAAEKDSSAWPTFLEKLESKKAQGDSLSPTLLRVMALGYEAVGLNEKAAQTYREVVLKDPTDEIARRSLLRLMFAQGQYLEMIPIYKEILNPKQSTYARDLLQLGALYLKLDERETAKEYLQKAIAADNSLGEAYQLLGHLCEIEERWQESLDYYMKFLELNPSALKQILDRLVSVAVQAQDQEKPIALLQEVIAEGDTSSWAAEQLGRLYYHSKNYKSAFEVLEPLRKTETLSDNGYYILGFLYSRVDSFPKAVEALNRVKSSRPDFIPIYLTLGRLYFTMGEQDKAAGVLEEGLAKAPPEDRENRKELLFSLANVCYERGDEQNTESYLKKVLEIDPDYAPALNYLGYFYAEHGNNLQEAQRMINRALEQEPENGHYIDSLGWVLFKMGDLQAALRYIKDSLAKLGDHAEVYEHLGDIYCAMNERELALKAWNKSLEIDSGNTNLKKKLQEFLTENKKQELK